MEVQYVDEQDVRDIVEQDCQFDIEDCGIGYYEHGNGKYKDISIFISTYSCYEVVYTTSNYYYSIPYKG